MLRVSAAKGQDGQDMWHTRNITEIRNGFGEKNNLQETESLEDMGTNVPSTLG